MILHDRTAHISSRNNWLLTFTTELVRILHDRTSHNSLQQNLL